MASMSNSEPFLRPYNADTDHDHVFRVCQKTASPDLRSEPWIAITPYIWCVPYLTLRPAHCFVVDDGTPSHNAIGYILCAPDTASFVSDYISQYIPTLESLDPILKNPPMDTPADWNKDRTTALLQILYKPEGMLHSDYPKLLEGYPAHLHIDILEGFQGKGLGTRLMEMLVGKLEEAKVKGLHLTMDGRNVGAEKFYLAVGFERFPEVLDAGKSGELGRDEGGSLWMVRKIYDEKSGGGCIS